jgi:hypothetical protein
MACVCVYTRALRPQAVIVADADQASIWHSRTKTPPYSTLEPTGRLYVLAPSLSLMFLIVTLAVLFRPSASTDRQ